MISTANSEMYTTFWLLTMYWSTFSWIQARQLPASPLPRKLAMIAGSNRIELAKMIGITPDWLTLSGM